MNKILMGILSLILICAFNTNAQTLSYSSPSINGCSGNGQWVNAGISYNIPIPNSPANKFWRLVIYATGQVGAANSTNPQTPSAQTGGSLAGSTSVNFTTNGSGNLGLSATLQYSDTYNSTPWTTSGSFTNTSGGCSGCGSYINVYYANTAMNFKVNNVQQTGVAPVSAWKCDGDDRLMMSNINAGSIQNYSVKVEKGSWNGTTFSPFVGGTFTSATTVTTNVPSSIDLNALFSPNLNLYTGYLRVTLNVTGPTACGSIVGTKAQMFNVGNFAVQTDYFLYRNATLSGCTFPTINKPLQTTLPITSAMPTTECALNSAVGWQGSRKAGINGIDVNGSSSWTLKVYEVNGTGASATVRKTGAPDIVNMTGAGDLTGGAFIRFNDNSIGFNSANPPFYAGVAGGLDYFRDYYNWSSTGGTLTTYSAKVYCTEFTVTTLTCTKTNKSFFRIANGTGGNTWKTTNSDIEELEELSSDLTIYPNPVQDNFTIEYDNLSSNAFIQLYDQLGRKVLQENNLQQNGRKVNVSNLPTGVYFYHITSGENSFTGKLIKN